MYFHCTFCGCRIEADVNATDSHVTCPDCRSETPVPRLKTSPPPVATPPKGKSDSGRADSSWGRKSRQVFLYGLLACFVVGAATAIVALSSREFGETQAKVLMTTLSLGVFSLTGLCCAVLADQNQFKVFSGMGIAISVAGALFAVLTNWEFITGWELLLKGRFSFLIIAIAFGHAALLLAINTSNDGVRIARILTLGFILLVALFLLVFTQAPGSIVYAWTILGILAVLDALGTIVTIVLHYATKRSATD